MPDDDYAIPSPLPRWIMAAAAVIAAFLLVFLFGEPV